MDWTQELCLKLIREYRKREVLWKPRDQFYYNKTKKDEAWRELAETCGKNSDELKKKMDSLKGSYRREKTRAKKSFGTGKENDEIYESKWFAYTSLQFLDDKDSPCNNLSNVSDDTLKEYVDSETADDSSEEGSEVESDELVKETKNVDASDVEEAGSSGGKKLAEYKYSRKRLAKRKNSGILEDPRIAEAFRCLRRIAAVSKQPKDECSIFGDYVANKLKKFDNRTRAIAEHRISGILFDMEVNNGAQERTENSTNGQTSATNIFPVVKLKRASNTARKTVA